MYHKHLNQTFSALFAYYLLWDIRCSDYCLLTSFEISRSQGSLSRLDQDGADGEASLSKMDIVLSFTLEVNEIKIYLYISRCRLIVANLQID